MDSNIIKYILLIFLFSFKVSAVEFNGKFIQGHFIIGKTDPSSKVKIDKKQIRVSKDGYFAFGLSRDRKYDVVITIEENGVKEKITKRVQKRKNENKENTHTHMTALLSRSWARDGPEGRGSVREVWEQEEREGSALRKQNNNTKRKIKSKNKKIKTKTKSENKQNTTWGVQNKWDPLWIILFFLRIF